MNIFCCTAAAPRMAAAGYAAQTQLHIARPESQAAQPPRWRRSRSRSCSGARCSGAAPTAQQPEGTRVRGTVAAPTSQARRPAAARLAAEPPQQRSQCQRRSRRWLARSAPGPPAGAKLAPPPGAAWGAHGAAWLSRHAFIFAGRRVILRFWRKHCYMYHYFRAQLPSNSPN